MQCNRDSSASSITSVLKHLLYLASSCTDNKPREANWVGWQQIRALNNCASSQEIPSKDIYKVFSIPLNPDISCVSTTGCLRLKCNVYLYIHLVLVEFGRLCI